MRTLNLGILAHVDAGKTSLTERLLYAAGVIDEVGRVDDGNTQTDSLALERQRGITIKSAVVSFALDDVTVNLIDTPGHPDFVAEVERVLSVLDGAVLVISAVEGVQPQTRVLMRALRRLQVPTLLFVNKIDRVGAQHQPLLRRIADKLTGRPVAMSAVDRLGSRGAEARPYGLADPAFRTALLDVLTHGDDALLAAYLQDGTGVPDRRLRAALVTQVGRASVHPVFFGSAMTGAGVPSLMAGISELLPAEHRDDAGPVSGRVFKIERGERGEKVAYVRLFSGRVRTRDQLRFGSAGEAKVTAVHVFDRGAAARRDELVAGQIGKLWGLGDVRVGDRVGDGGREREGCDDHHFAPPTLETVVAPLQREQKPALAAALNQLAEQDPLIDLRQDDARQELSVSLYGEVQKEVIQTTLADEFGVAVTFRPTTAICIERPVGTGAAFEIIDTSSNPFLATVGLRVDPAPVGAGVTFRLEVELGSLPYAFMRAVEETVHLTLREGLHGWQVVDCTVTMTHSGYFARQSHSHATFDKTMSSTAGDFRGLTPLVLAGALQRAGTRVYEPLHRFELELPADTFGSVLPALAGLGAVPDAPEVHGGSGWLTGTVPVARVRELQQRLPGLTRGEGMLESSFAGYRPVDGPPPARPRTDHNPLDRVEYLRHVRR